MSITDIINFPNENFINASQYLIKCTPKPTQAFKNLFYKFLQP